MKTKQKPVSIQRFVRLREIAQDVLCFKQQSFRSQHLRSYSAVLQVSSINFNLMSEHEQEAILAGWRGMLNSLRSYGVDIHIRIEPYDLKDYEEHVRMAESSASGKDIDDHVDFVYSLASKRALIQRKFYIIVSADEIDPKTARRKTQEELFDIARSQLRLRCLKITEELSRIGLVATRLEKVELANYYRSCWHASGSKKYPMTTNQYRAAEHVVLSRATRRRKRKAQDQTSEPGTIEKERLPGLVRLAEIVVPSALQVERSHLVCGAYGIDEYVAGIAVVALPAYVDDGFLARLIEIDEPNIDIVLSIKPMNSDQYKSRLRRKLVGYHGSQHFDERRGRGVNHDIKVAAEEVNDLLSDLARQTEYVYSQRLHILVRGRGKTELRERSDRIFAMLQSLELTGVSTTWEHHLALRATLPESNYLLQNEKMLDTSSIVTEFPFTSEVLSTETGILNGIGPDGSLIILDPFSDQLENANQTVFAKSGAGKSFSQKIAVYRAWMQGIACAVIDPDSEFIRLCRRTKGEYVSLDATALRINPFDLFASAEKERNIVEEKVAEILPLFDLLLADRDASLLKNERSLLHRCIIKAYGNRGITPDPATHQMQPPCMRDVFDLLESDACGEDTTRLAERLERYVSLFPETTEVALENQCLFFGIRDLDAELRPVGVFLITSYVWTQMRRRRESARKWLLFIDEAWSLMEFEEGGRFLSNIARRARKYGLGLVTITQNVEDFLSDPNGRTILGNSSITLLMRQAPETIDSVVSTFRLSDNERKYLLSALKGQALISARGSRVPLQVVASQIEYWFAVSNPAEELKLSEMEEFEGDDQDTSKALAVRVGENSYDLVVSGGSNA